MASVPNTARPTRLLSRCSSSRSDASGDPTRIRFSTEYTARAWHDSHGVASCRSAGKSGRHIDTVSEVAAVTASHRLERRSLWRVSDRTRDVLEELAVVRAGGRDRRRDPSLRGHLRNRSSRGFRKLDPPRLGQQRLGRCCSADPDRCRSRRDHGRRARVLDPHRRVDTRFDPVRTPDAPHLRSRPWGADHPRNLRRHLLLRRAHPRLGVTR